MLPSGAALVLLAEKFGFMLSILFFAQVFMLGLLEAQPLKLYSYLHLSKAIDILNYKTLNVEILPLFL